MHRPCVISIVMGVLMLSTTMHVDAQSSRCSAIRDDDLRAYCRAKPVADRGSAAASESLIFGQCAAPS
jgi:hypothetical protein